MIDQGKSVRYVAACLGRSPSTISREVQRNGWKAFLHVPGLRALPHSGPEMRSVHPVAISGQHRPRQGSTGVRAFSPAVAHDP
ncbi:helix-turn-helix domain-containing protein [Actinomycetaceae bacterium WB03_NA08]|uniref:Helix-turn-helix domain-containing protein n=1 Tax=Scrofimicrobium canadense TaxID=2652290 RepID=A0A6N7W4F1_9ACTO|nr:helix-turn-helix domain-containing protein [Scrofimicrobium canadense]